MRQPFLAALAATLGALAASSASADDVASIARGGRLYDHWGVELKERLPGKPHPLFVARRNEMVSDSWRCVECHGWDYEGKHGIVGIRQRMGGDPAAVVALLKDATHRYGEFMGEGELLDLARFVTRGQVDIRGAIDAARRASPAVVSSFEKKYGTICGACHGLDGRRLRDIAPLGESARQRPEEILHVVLNGHPNRNMPALRILGAEFAGRMLAFLQTLPTDNLSASIAKGGRLYDDWAAETGVRSPPVPHPAYPPTAYFANDAALTWRCKECHGWDYRGKDGAYAGGRHATGIKGIRALAGSPPSRIAAILRDNTHRYDAVLKERDLRDIAQFVALGQVDTDDAINRSSGRARGDAARGHAYFDTLCASCHGTDGRRLLTIPPLGRVARSSPWESLHKMMNGHPDEKMPALRELDQQLLSNVLAYLQELPERRELDGDTGREGRRE